MKFTTTLFALFFLSALTSHLPSTTAEAVLDIEGNPVRNGGTYYILPVFIGMGGGIERATTGNETCPLTVVQSPSDFYEGLPIRISSPFRIAIIKEDLPLDLAFTSVPLCAQTPSQWTIVKGKSERQWSVKLTGYEDTVEGWFFIKRILLSHKITFCSSLSNNDECSDVGVHIDTEGNRRLVLTENAPLEVQFKKASSSAA